MAWRATTRSTSCCRRRGRWRSRIVGSARASRDTMLYLSRALAIGENPRFEVGTRTIDDLSDEVLGRSRLVILNDVSPTEAVAARLKRFVENGGGLLVVYGSQATWPASAADLLPAMPVGTVDRSRGGAGVARQSRVRARGLRAVPRAAERRFFRRSLLQLPQRDAGQGRADAGALRRRRAGGDGADGGTRPRAAVDLDARPLLERPGAQAGLPAVRSSAGPASGGLPRARQLGDGRAGHRPVAGGRSEQAAGGAGAGRGAAPARRRRRPRARA